MIPPRRAGPNRKATRIEPTVSTPERTMPRAKATRVRYTVVAMGCALAFLAYIDRVAISQAAPAISSELHLSPFQMGLVFSAFGLAYSLFEIPSGWLCDRFGARSVLTRVVLWWSFFTTATGWAWNFGSLLGMRALFGAGESGCFPGLARVFQTWLAPEERNAAEGLKAASARWGAAVTPAIVALLLSAMNWRHVFLALGFLGLLWAAWFWSGYRDDPRLHPTVNRAELERIPGHSRGNDFASVPWSKLFGSLSVWGLCIQWFCHYYGFYFYITWLPTYLQQVRGFNVPDSALAAGLPLLSAGTGSLAGGWAASALARRFESTAAARRLLGFVAYSGAATLLLAFPFIASPTGAVAVMSISAFAAELSGPISWTAAMDMGGRHVSTLSALMNTLGQLGGAVAPAIMGWLVTASDRGWTVAFCVSSAIYGAGALCWASIDPTTPIDQQ